MVQVEVVVQVSQALIGSGGGHGGNGVIPTNVVLRNQTSSASVGEVVGSDVYYAGGGGGE